MGLVSETELVLIINIHENEQGKTQLIFRRFLTNNNTDKSLTTLMKLGIIHHFFSEPVSISISSIQLTYLNSFDNLSPNKEGYQMSEKGPDSYFINYQEVKKPLKLKWKMKRACEYLPIGRKSL